ncbi:MAG: RNA-binding cell elongation regulator Jag/EloR [Omnitrophica WOR_2 bacterium]
MREKRATLEVIAPTVEEAVSKGLADLGLPAEAVEVEILDQGSRGLFGIGSRQARIRLAVKSAPIEAQQVATTSPVPEVIAEPATIKPPAASVSMKTTGEEEDDLRVARETVTELLEKMKVRARVSAHYGEADEGSTRIPILIDVNGDDLSILIGRRAETLSALQYISSLIVSKELGRSISLIVDVEGYRVRREGQIRQLARRMADQAVKTGRRQILEPMPASERRIIHMELRDNPNVKTESIGEEPRRKVTIIPIE